MENYSRKKHEIFLCQKEQKNECLTFDRFQGFLAVCVALVVLQN